MTLLALQRDFRLWLTAESAEAADRFGAGAGPGLTVYLNNYRTQLMTCLSGSYTITRSWIGEAAFAAAAAGHIDRLPPHDWTLDAYALDFPGTLDTLYPGDPEIGDLARLERALALAFVGRDALRIDPAALAGIDWDAVRLTMVPTLLLLPMATNADLIWSALARGDAPPAAVILAGVAHVLVWRDGYTAMFRAVDAVEADALAYLQAGARFGALCARLTQQWGEEQGTQRAGEMLGRWLADGCIAAVEDDPAEA